MKQISILDVTLRDGGCVNDFNFGNTNIKRILNALEKARVDVIELGYLDDKSGSLSGRTKFINESVIAKEFLEKKEGIRYVAMIDCGKYDISKLRNKTESDIDGIRIAFHKKDRNEVISILREVINKGYDAYIQPMITLRYSDSELLKLIDDVNNSLSDASGFYIVDSFGEMRPNDMMRLLNLVDHNLAGSMPIGYHSHNNLQMSYSNAVSLLQFPTNRDLMIDSSIMGMGKGAGNLNTELLAEHLNIYYGKDYDVKPLLEVMDKVLNQIRQEFFWGYAPEYYLSSANHCTPSYASHFYNKHMLPIDQVSELLSMIDEDKKISFDKKYAEDLYHEYNAKKFVDDENDVNEIISTLRDKELLLIAPGKSILKYKKEISELVNRDNIVAISLNIADDFGQEYELISKEEAYDQALDSNKKLIVMSSVTKGRRGNVRILNYDSWIEHDGRIRDSSAVAAFLLAEKAGIRRIFMAGFDGYSIDINGNYYDPDMRVPVKSDQIKDSNEYYRNRIKKMRRDGIDIEFVTPSKYDEEY